MASTRLLLFGAPGAGKSSLLAAAEKVSGPFTGEVEVVDCDGKSALQMLQAEEPFARSHPLRKQVLNADAVLLAVDVSAPKKQINDDFRQSARWLKGLHEIRGRRADVSDLPVFVVLTKCDLLARKDDTPEIWKKKIDEAIRQYEENFRKFLKQHEPGFGTLQLKVLASAIEQPTSPTPYGVAELFAECLASARAYQERRRLVQGRIQNVFVGLLGMIALLILSAAFLFAFQPPERGTSLDEEVQALLPKPTATPAERVAGTIKRLEEREKALTRLIGKPEFNTLPADTQAKLAGYRGEIAKYLELHQRSQTELKLPHLAKNDAELKELEKKVRDFVVPVGESIDWTDTRLGRRSREVLAEYDILQSELKREADWFLEHTKANNALLLDGIAIRGRLVKGEKDAAREAKDWHTKLQQTLSVKPAMPREDSVPGVSRFIYDDLAKFDPARAAHKSWQASLEELCSEWKTMEKRLGQ